MRSVFLGVDLKLMEQPEQRMRGPTLGSACDGTDRRRHHRGRSLFGAFAANQRWLDQHFLPSWFLPRQWYVLIETLVRLVMAASGVSLALFARPRSDSLRRERPRVPSR